MAYTVEQHKAVFFTVGRERPIAKIVLHWMATNLAGCDATFAAGQRQASAHYGLEDDKRHQYVKESDTAWHAGNRTINHESIGIEHSAQPGRPASEATIANSVDLCTALCRKYGLTADDIHVHNEYFATQCPGTLPVSRIREAVRANLTTPPVTKDWFDMATLDDLNTAIDAAIARACADGGAIEKRLDAHTAFELDNLKATLPGLLAAKIPAAASGSVDVAALASAVVDELAKRPMSTQILGKA